jgi:diguanylate cyclase (GGDEF)-like protein
MVLDLPTLFVVTVFITGTAGLLLLFSWLQNRRTLALAWWGGAYLVASMGTALLAGRGVIADVWSIDVANALILINYGAMWTGVRCFEGRNTPWIFVAAGALVWLAACQNASFYGSLQARIVLISVLVVTSTLLVAWELWRARDKELMSRWPAIILLLIHAGLFALRIPFSGRMSFPLTAEEMRDSYFALMVFQSLFVTFCMAVLWVNMAKERAELEQRRAALIDPLTGVANRRAFFERGGKMLGSSGPTTLLLFDLDRFKEINDTAGHQAGDRVLKAFCQVAGGTARSGDLFARIGGEEFACLLPNTSMTDALHAAERIREAFATHTLRAGLPDATVSVGVAHGSRNRDLSGMLAAADRALYRAKANGRNRVEASQVPIAVSEARDAPCTSECLGYAGS